MCDCGEEEFILNLYIKDSKGHALSNAGSIEVFPEGHYKKGQMIVVLYNPAESYTFVRWEVSGNYANQYGLNTVSNFPFPSTVFIMTGDTSITAVVEGKKRLKASYLAETNLENYWWNVFGIYYSIDVELVGNYSLKIINRFKNGIRI